jgi:hypothetical protein
MRIGFVISLVVFFVAVGPILLDQWIGGYVDTRFILGTAALSAGVNAGAKMHRLAGAKIHQ